MLLQQQLLLLREISQDSTAAAAATAEEGLDQLQQQRLQPSYLVLDLLRCSLPR
jgi:hypothetical protein